MFSAHDLRVFHWPRLTVAPGCGWQVPAEGRVQVCTVSTEEPGASGSATLVAMLLRPLHIIDVLSQEMGGVARPGGQPWVLGTRKVFRSCEVKAHILFYR